MKATFIRGVLATLPAALFAFVSACLPPEELQAPSAATMISAAPVATAFFCHRTMSTTSLSRHSAVTPRRWDQSETYRLYPASLQTETPPPCFVRYANVRSAIGSGVSGAHGYS